MMKFLCSIFLSFGLVSCSSSKEEFSEDREARSRIEEDPNISLKKMPLKEYTLQYAQSGELGQATIVFLHGTPGSWRSLGRLMSRTELQAQARMISIDRPGWGNSQLFSGERSEPNFTEQARLIEPLIRQLKNEAQGHALILVGHSYGGSIAPYFAFTYPDLVDGVLMAASAIDPDLGKPRWYNYAARVWPISRLIGDGLAKANDEIWGVAPALQEMENWWSETTLPMIYVQGEDDELVHPKNLLFAEENLSNITTRVVRLPDQGHLLHVQRQDLLSELSLELLQKSEDTL